MVLIDAGHETRIKAKQRRGIIQCVTHRDEQAPQGDDLLQDFKVLQNGQRAGVRVQLQKARFSH